MGLSKADVNKLKADKDVEGLIKALKDADGNIKCKVIRILARLGESQAVKPSLH